MSIQVCCPNPACRSLYDLTGLLDLGALPETGFPAGFTEAMLSVDCPLCATHLELRLPVAWRMPSGNPSQ